MTDFDFTLTRAFYLLDHHHSRNDVNHTRPIKADSSFKALNESEYIPNLAREINRNLYDKFRPIEKDSAISHKEKFAHMQNWWTGNMEAFIISKMKKQDYAQVVLTSKLLLRHGINDLLHLASDMRIPISIVSGGIKEIIQATFYAIFFNGEVPHDEIHSYFIDEKHIRVIANTFEYDNDIAVDY